MVISLPWTKCFLEACFCTLRTVKMKIHQSRRSKLKNVDMEQASGFRRLFRVLYTASWHIEPRREPLSELLNAYLCSRHAYYFPKPHISWLIPGFYASSCLQCRYFELCHSSWMEPWKAKGTGFLHISCHGDMQHLVVTRGPWIRFTLQAPISQIPLSAMGHSWTARQFEVVREDFIFTEFQ